MIREYIDDDFSKSYTHKELQSFFHLTDKLTTEIPEAWLVIVNPRQRAAKLHSFNPEDVYKRQHNT